MTDRFTTIGIHGWEPALTTGVTTASSGAGAWLRYLITSYLEAGHDVVWVSDLEEKNSVCETVSCDLASQICDVVIVMWRWAMPLYPARNYLYEEQMRLIAYCINRGTRVVVHDQDHLISPEDLAYLSNNDIHIYAPELAKRPGVTRLMFPNPHLITDPFSISDWQKRVDLTYVGNNYGRFDQTTRFLSSRHGMNSHVNIEVYGNWLEPHPEREAPEVVKAEMPNVKFMGRLPQTELIDKLSEAYFTIHLFKKSYGPTGFVTMRWAEAAAAGTLAFVPTDFFLPYEWEDLFNKSGLIVNDARELVTRMAHFSSAGAVSRGWYQSALRLQANFVRTYMTLEPWMRLAKGQL